MEVSTRADRFGEDDTSCVDGLENTKKVASPRDLLNKNGCQTFGPQFLVDAQEIYFGAVQNLGPHTKRNRNARNERDEFP